MTDQTKNNFTGPKGIKEILDKLESSKDNYYGVLSLSKSEDLQVGLNR